VQGLAHASGLTFFEDDLVAVAGGNDRDVYVLPVATLEAGDTVVARTLAVDIRPDAPLMGADRFATQGYTLGQIWKVPVDFEAVAAQGPDRLYLAERNRRLLLWGRLRRETGGRLAGLNLAYVTVAPGADRSGRSRGDWRDKGPGASGLVAVQRSRRTEDLYLLEGSASGQPVVVRRMDRFGSNLGGLRARWDAGSPDPRALSWSGDHLVLLLGASPGRLVDLSVPDAPRGAVVPLAAGTPAPQVAGVERWTGMAHGPDGTVYLVSGGDPAVLAWRRP
jgi:hypothetical protein